MDLSSNFIQNIRESFGDEGREWLSRLPGLIQDSSERWGLTNIKPVSNLSYNFVAFATMPYLPTHFPQSDGRNIVFKIGVLNNELTSEMEALKVFNGGGICKLLDCIEEEGVFLLERLMPGQMLAQLEDDNERTNIAIDVMELLWKPLESSSLLSAGEQVPALHKFIKLSDWFDGLKKIRVEFDGGTGVFPKEIFERVESNLPELFDDELYLLHGDFHHYNILSSDRGWLAIDPKGVIGPVGYEIGPLMINPWKKPMDGTMFKVQARNRVDIIRERLGWERERIIQWALSHAILSAWWNYPNLDWGYSLNCAKALSEIK